MSHLSLEVVVNKGTQKLMGGMMIWAVALGLSLVPAPRNAQAGGITASSGNTSKDNFDVRYQTDKARGSVSTRLKSGKAAGLRNGMNAAKRALNAKVPGLKVKMDESLGVPVRISGKGDLAASKGKPEKTVTDFVSENSALFGVQNAQEQLKTQSAYKNPENDLQWVTLKQEIGGVPVFRGTLRGVVNGKGALSSVVSELASGLDESVLAATAQLTAEDALVIAARQNGFAVSAADLVREQSSDDGHTVHFAATEAANILHAQQVIFPLAPGEAVMAWQVVIGSRYKMFNSVVDAEEGSILFNKNAIAYQTQTATYSYFNDDSPAPGTPYPLPPVTDPAAAKPQTAPISQTITTLISEDATASPLGWITDFDTLSRGNNARAGLDQFLPEGLDQNQDDPSKFSMAYGHGTGPSPFNRNFVFDYSPAPGGTDQPGSTALNDYNSGSITNMFFWTNRFHDYMYRLGFTEAAGNFQNDNFSRGGFGSDAVLALGQVGFLDPVPFSNGAFFGTGPDGIPGQLLMLAWDDTSPVRDSAIDQQVLIHELTHGLSNRLVGNASGLFFPQGQGLGEGWSDFYSLAIVSEFPATKDQDPDKVYPQGGWLTKDYGSSPGFTHDNYFYGVRRFPYSTDRDINPLTFADADPAQRFVEDGLYPESPFCFSIAGAEAHNLGEIWATALWQARAAVMKDFRGDGFASDAAAYKEGNRHMLQIVTDGMKLTPNTPSFTEARDAIFEAALAQSSNPAGWSNSDPANPDIAGQDEISLWKGFAARGLGSDAVAPSGNNDVGVELDALNTYYIRRSSGTIADPDDANVLLNLADDDAVTVTLPVDETFTFYGQTYNEMYIGTNGYITFGDGSFDAVDTSAEVTMEHHFSLPRVSGLLTNLDPSTSGKIALNVDPDAQTVEVTWYKVPNSGMENENSFSIKLWMDGSANAEQIELKYGQCDAPEAICGLAEPGDGSTPTGFTESDLSAYHPTCNLDLPRTWFVEHFGETAGDDFDLQSMKLEFSHKFVQGWSQTLEESFTVPLVAHDAIMTDQTGNTFIDAGDTVDMRIPLESQLVRGHLSGVLGLLTPISEGITIINPILDYGNIAPGAINASTGTPFRVQILSTVPCGATVRFKIDYSSDQGLVGSRFVDITVGSGAVGPVVGETSWPPVASQGTVGGSISAVDTEILLSSQTAMKGGTLLKNSRTSEIILTTAFFSTTNRITVLRGQKNTAPAPMLAGDVLEFLGVPIPDGSLVSLPVTPPEFSGNVGRIRVTIGSITHPRLGDLVIKLSNSYGKSAILMANLDGGFAGEGVLSNITFDSDALLSVQDQQELVSGTSYKPLQSLEVFTSQFDQAHTTWTLTLMDSFTPFTGYVSSWSMDMSIVQFCPGVPVQNGSPSNSSGWTASTYGEPGLSSAYVKNGSPSSFVLNSRAASSDVLRLPSWKTPGIPLSNYPNQVYRFHAYVYRSGQSSPTAQNEIPFMRLRAGVDSTMLSMTTYYFDTTRYDPGSAGIMLANAPSTNPATPSHYYVDLDPVDVPALYSDTSHELSGMVESFSYFPTQQGNFEIVETRIERYSAPSDEEGTVVRTYGPADFADGYQNRGNTANTVWASDFPYSRPEVTTSTQGVTLSSARVAPVGAISWVAYDLHPISPYVMKRDKMYRLRYHVTSNNASHRNPILRLRAQHVRYNYNHDLVFGPPNIGSPAEMTLARQVLPGVGTLNPNRRGNETQGGFYDHYINGPEVMPTSADLNTLKVGFDMFDMGYFGTGTPEQEAEAGRFTLDSVEITEFDKR